MCEVCSVMQCHELLSYLKAEVFARYGRMECGLMWKYGTVIHHIRQQLPVSGDYLNFSGTNRPLLVG